MSDFEDKISFILSNPAEMEKITRLASQLMGAPSPAQADAQHPGRSAAPQPGGSGIPGSPSAADGSDTSGLGALFGPGGPLSGLGSMGGTAGHGGASAPDSAIDGFPDAGMLKRLGAMLAPGAQDDKTALLRAMGPYMSPERRAKLEKAIKFARLARVAKTVFGESGQDTGGTQDV